MEIYEILETAAKLRADYPEVYQWCREKAAWEHITIGDVLVDYKDYIDEQTAN